MSMIEHTMEGVDSALQGLNAEMDAAELHGHLVGLLCTQGTVDADDWLRRVVPEAEDEPGGAVDILRGIFAHTVRQVADPLLDFHLLLADEAAPLEQRVLSLGEWCQGFLLGLSEGGAEQLDDLPEDSAEIVRDMVEIAGAGSYLLEDGEEDENAYMELVEYVRTGVLLVSEELNPSRSPPRPSTTYH